MSQIRERRHSRRINGLLMAAAVFILSLTVALVTLVRMDQLQVRRVQERAALLGADYAGRIRLTLQSGSNLVYMLGVMVRLEGGALAHFDELAGALLTFQPHIRNIGLAPNGIVSQIAPLKNNQSALGHDLLRDDARQAEARLARDTGKITIAGPFPLLQGGNGLALRYPVFLPPSIPGGEPRFWGLAILTFDFPAILESVHLDQLANLGYVYELSRVHPDTGSTEILAGTRGSDPVEPLEYSVRVPNYVWKFAIAPTNGWHDWPLLSLQGAAALALCLMLAGLAGLAVDLADKKRIVERMSRTDPLTGLFNRRAFMERLDEALAVRQSETGNLALCYLDLDEFKALNDTYGHAAGDSVLTQFAARLASSLRPGDFASRLGGDEFAMVIHMTEEEMIQTQNARAQQSLFDNRLSTFMKNMEAPYAVEGRNLPLSSSMGVLLFSAVSKTLPATSSEILLNMADQSMYRAKQAGKHRLSFWDGPAEGDEKPDADGEQG